MPISLNGSSGITTPAVTSTTAIGTASGGTNLGGATPFTSGGVVYASSSSALATGSVLSFDGSSLGIGTSSPLRKLHVKGGTGLSQFESTTTSCYVFLGDSTSSVVDNQGIAVTGNNLLLVTGGLERLRIDSAGNVGIGTSSPATFACLGVNKAITTGSVNVSAGFSDAVFNTLRITHASGSLGLNFDDTNLIFQSGGVTPTTRMTLNSSGNLGLGVTPSAWGSGERAIQLPGTTFGNGVFSSSNNTGVIVGANAYYSSTGYKRITANAASILQFVVGETRFLTAGSSTADSAISFTQAMTLDANGSLGIGTTSPTVKLDVATSSGSANSLSTHIMLSRGTSNGAYFSTERAPASNDVLALGFGVNSAERMRIMSDGKVGIGTSTPNNDLEVLSASNPSIALNSTSASLYCYYGMTAGTVGGTLFTFGQSYSAVYPAGSTALANNTYGVILNASNATGILRFQTADTERARIDASGNLGIGTSSPSYRLEVFQSGSVNVFQVQGNATDGSNLARYHQSANSGDNGFIAFLTETSPSTRGSITYNRAGGLTAYNTTSDYRAKDITGPVTGSGALIDSVPVYMGKMKDATQERPMFLAHETPNYAHTGVKDAVDADGKPVYQQMDASALIPVMWAEIQSLRQRLSAANL